MAKTYEINPLRAISETLDNETIVINLENGSYYSMNRAGSAVWNALLEGVPLPMTNPSVIDFLSLLEKEGLLTATDGTAGAGEELIIDEAPSFERYDDMQQMLLADPIHDVDERGWPVLKK